MLRYLGRNSSFFLFLLFIYFTTSCFSIPKHRQFITQFFFLFLSSLSNPFLLFVLRSFYGLLCWFSFRPFVLWLCVSCKTVFSLSGHFQSVSLPLSFSPSLPVSLTLSPSLYPCLSYSFHLFYSISSSFLMSDTISCFILVWLFSASLFYNSLPIFFCLFFRFLFYLLRTFFVSFFFSCTHPFKLSSPVVFSWLDLSILLLNVCCSWSSVKWKVNKIFDATVLRFLYFLIFIPLLTAFCSERLFFFFFLNESV